MPFLTYTRPLFARNALKMRDGCCRAAREPGAAAERGRRPVPVAHDQRRGGVGLLRRRHRAVPHQRRHRVCAREVRRGDRRRRLPRARRDRRRSSRPRGSGRRSASGAAPAARRSTSTASPGPDEYTTVVNDNLFTNVMARYNLRYAARSRADRRGPVPRGVRADGRAGRLRARPRSAEWERAAEAMVIPYDEVVRHPPAGRALPRPRGLGPRRTRRRTSCRCCCTSTRWSSTASRCSSRRTSCWRCSCSGDEFSDEKKRADFDYYDPLTTGDSTLSAVVQSIIAAEIGYRDLALEYFRHALFVDLDDLHNNASDGVHVASTGGVWSSLVYGFGGMRDAGGAPRVRPAAAGRLAGAAVPDPVAGHAPAHPGHAGRVRGRRGRRGAGGVRGARRALHRRGGLDTAGAARSARGLGCRGARRATSSARRVATTAR